MTMKYFDNLRKYFCSKRCFIGSESRAISRQQTIRQADNSDNNGRWHFLGIIDRSDDDHDDCNDHDDLSLLEWKKLIYWGQLWYINHNHNFQHHPSLLVIICPLGVICEQPLINEEQYLNAMFGPNIPLENSQERWRREAITYMHCSNLHHRCRRHQRHHLNYHCHRLCYHRYHRHHHNHHYNMQKSSGTRDSESPKSPRSIHCNILKLYFFGPIPRCAVFGPIPFRALSLSLKCIILSIASNINTI